MRPILDTRPAWMRNLVGALAGYLVIHVPVLLAWAILAAVGWLSSTPLEAPGWSWAPALLAFLALPFAAGFVSSRLAASRAAAWILIALLVIPGAVWGTGLVISVGGGGGIPWITRTLPVAVLVWLGAWFQERRAAPRAT